MATLIQTNGKRRMVQPANGTDFSLEEVYRLLNIERVEMVYLADGRIMLLDEEGKLTGAAFNQSASLLYGRGRIAYDTIAGDVLVCKETEFL